MAPAFKIKAELVTHVKIRRIWARRWEKHFHLLPSGLRHMCSQGQTSRHCSTRPVCWGWRRNLPPEEMHFSLQPRPGSASGLPEPVQLKKMNIKVLYFSHFALYCVFKQKSNTPIHIYAFTHMTQAYFRCYHMGKLSFYLLFISALTCNQSK